MSNIVKAIEATDTGERKIIPVKSKLFQDVFSMREEFSTTYVHEVARVYKIGITLGNTCMVPEHQSLKNDNAYSHAIQRTKEQVIEAIFGEFRQDFRMIERHLYNYEFEEAVRALGAMETKMFSTTD